MSVLVSLPAPAPASDPAGLPTELLVEIFQYLPLKAMLAASAACKSWQQAARTRALWEPTGVRLLGEAAALGQANAARLETLSRRSFTEKASGERIEFLRNTLDITRQYISAQSRGGWWRQCRHPLLVHALLVCLVRQLSDIEQMLTGICVEAYSITCNFDMLDFALRRLYEELRTLVPDVPGYDPPGPSGSHDGVPDPRVYEVIRDPDARVVWQTAVGSELCAVPYDVFERRIIARSFPDALQQDPRFAAHLRFHLTFPSTGLVTTYRFQLLLAQFGPFRQFAANFDRFVLHPGFLGLINMIKAEELLVQHLPRLTRNTVLIRYSRRQPDVLAFTSIDLASKRIEHRRNIDRAGKPIPVAAFLERVFPGYALLPMGIDDIATRFANSFTFARGTDPYIYSAADFSSSSSSSSSSGNGGGIAGHRSRSGGVRQHGGGSSNSRAGHVVAAAAAAAVPTLSDTKAPSPASPSSSLS